MASEGKNGSIQALRFVFVMMIFMSHFYYRGFTTFEAGGDCGVAYSQVNALLYVFPPVRFIDFFLGIMLYKFCASRQPATTWWAEIVLVLLLILALAVYPFTDAKLRNAPLYWLVLLPFIYVFPAAGAAVSLSAVARFPMAGIAEHARLHAPPHRVPYLVSFFPRNTHRHDAGALLHYNHPAQLAH